LKCEIMTIGTELLLGLINDSNAPYIARKLAEIGIISSKKSSAIDDVDVISEQIKTAVKQNDILIITGGLGSTHDDLTREALAKALSKELVFQPKIAASIEQKVKCLERPVSGLIQKQAYLPEGSEPIMPAIGTAPGIRFERNRKAIFALPGVFSEMKLMLEEEVIPFLKNRLPKKRKIVLIRAIKTAGEGELLIEERIKEIIDKYSNPSISILPYPGEVHLQIVAEGYQNETKALVARVEGELGESLGNLVYGYDEDTLEKVAGDLLKKHELKISLVESCTGGMLSNRMTNTPGSSAYFWGGVVAYSNEIKRKLIGVSGQDLLKHGAVSAQVALAMAEGGRHLMQTDVSLSVTGIAGPTGETEGKPVGLVFIGLAWREGSFCERFQFFGTREEIKTKASQAALNLLRLFLLDTFEKTGSEVS